MGPLDNIILVGDLNVTLSQSEKKGSFSGQRSNKGAG